MLGFAATTAMEFGLFLLAYAVLHRHDRLEIHLPGAAVMTIGWGLFKLAGGLLLAYYVSRATLLYGTIGAVVGLLLFLRLASGLFVFGPSCRRCSGPGSSGNGSPSRRPIRRPNGGTILPR